MTRQTLRFLLMQARRADDAMAAHEHHCFAQACGLAPEQVAVHSLLDGPATEWSAYDGLLVGGAGEFCVSKGNLPGAERVLDMFRGIVEAGHPMFASCFGYHCLVAALGGEIIHDPENTELGTYRLTLSPDGAQDVLFRRLPATFMAQEGHKDRATRHPDGVPNLAGSALSPHQALRIPGAPIWATQFHPELDRDTNLDRWYAYIDGYATIISPEEQAGVVERFVDSPESSGLLDHYVELVFGPGDTSR